MVFADEADFQAEVVKAAKTMGCLVYHTHDSRKSEKGFPDLVIVGRRGVLYRELKTESGRVTDEQHTWISRLTRAGADAAVWRPSDWPRRVVTELQAVTRR